MMNDRTWIGRKYKTQENVNAAIDKFIATAIRFEEKRDKAVYESVEYWSMHDKAVKWHEKARELMPPGS